MSRRQRIAAAFAITAAGAAGLWLSRSGGHPPRQDPGSSLGIAYTSDITCRDCHEEQFKAWTGSNHDWAMKPAVDPFVRADFSNASFTQFGITTRFFKRNGRFFVNTEGADGGLRDFEIKYTFGFDPLQQYLVEFPGGKLQCLTIAWDVKGKRWFPLYPNERIKPDDPLHWTGRYQNWNLMCGECHTTNYRKNYNDKSDTYRTLFAEMNVGCQACHGPGMDHADWAARYGKGFKFPPGQRPGFPEMRLTVDLKAGNSKLVVQSCAPCHSRRHWVARENASGKDFSDHFQVGLIRPNLYFPDGQQLDEVYVYGSFLQSKMHERGVRCTDCHDPHSVRTRKAGNELCNICHRPDPPERFPMPPGKKRSFDAASHHFHKEGTPGAQCVNCHMPVRPYMGVDPRQDHSFRVPRPDLSVKLGTPNACNLCHLDKAPQWAADAVAKWYGPNRRQEPNIGEILAPAWAGNATVAAGLSQWALNQKEPGYIRASALAALRSFGAPAAQTAQALLNDPDPNVRIAAVAAVENINPPAARLASAAPLLNDPIRSVRIEAARALAAIPASDFDAAQRQSFENALAEFRAAQMAMADMPSSWLNLAVVAAAQGKDSEAEQAYLHAIRIDPTFLPARVNLAQFYNMHGRNRDGERALREAIQQAPREGELHYSLGLLLAEEKRLPEAADALARAADLAPQRARVRYNYAVALMQLGRDADAESQLLKARDADPKDPDILNALIAFYAQRRRFSDALVYAEKLSILLPGDPRPAELIQRLRGRMATQ